MGNPHSVLAAPGLTPASAHARVRVSLIEDDDPVRELWWRYLTRAPDFLALDASATGEAALEQRARPRR